MPGAEPDVVDLLLSHHQQIKLLFSQLDTAQGDHKQQLFADLVSLLAVHESVEELVVHPLAQDKLPNGDTVVPDRLAEEQDAKQVLARLHEMGVADPAFDAELLELRDAVSAHAKAEEQLEFLRLREVTDPATLRRLAAAARAAAALSPTQPHPEVPPTATANLFLGAPIAVFDRVRDALSDAMSAGAKETP